MKPSPPHILIVISIIGLTTLSFLIGAILTYNHLFPYSLIYKAQLGITAWYEMNVGEIGEIEDGEDSQSEIAQDSVNSLTRWKVKKSSQYASNNGVTLVCSIKHPTAYLLDTDGKVTHSWSLLPKQTAILKRQRIEDAYLYPNGDLLAAYIIKQDGVEHRKLVKLTKNSDIIWEYEGSVHHEVNVDEHGNIYVLIDPITDTKPEGADFLNTPFLHDQIAILSPDGQELKRISLIQAFLHSDFSHFLKYLNVRDPKGDLTHNNSVEILPTKWASAYPKFEAGDLLVSLRNINTIAVINPKTEKVVWAKRGVWRGQHDPDFMANGKIMLYDNTGYKAKRGVSRILEIKVPSGKVSRVYGPKQRLQFSSVTRGKQQILPNGNMLVAASNQSRLLEWSEEKGVIWEINNPDFRTVTCTRWYEKETLPFLGVTK